MKVYKVEVAREGRWWMIEVPELDALTQARRISEIPEQAKSLVSTMLDCAPSEVGIEIASVTADGVDLLALADEVKTARQAAEECERAAQRAAVNAARLFAEKSTVRDAGELLGVSHQRVSQLVKS